MLQKFLDWFSTRVWKHNVYPVIFPFAGMRGDAIIFSDGSAAELTKTGIASTWAELIELCK